MQQIAFLQNLSSWEIILIFLVVLLFFGAKRLPDLARSFGKSMKEFKRATSDIEEDIRTAMNEDEAPKAKKSAKPKPDSSPPATTAPKEVESEAIAEKLESDDTPPRDVAATESEDDKKMKNE